MNRTVVESTDAPKVSSIPTDQEVLEWAVDTFGQLARDPRERAARLLEEALEIAQCQELPFDVVQRIATRVYTRPRGDLRQEIGGTALTLMALAAAAGMQSDEAIVLEWRRVLSKESAWWRQKHDAKVADGTADLAAQLDGGAQ